MYLRYDYIDLLSERFVIFLLQILVCLFKLFLNQILIFMTPFIGSLITFIGTLIVAGITIINSWIARKDTKKNNLILDLQSQKKVIEQKMNEFYIPLEHQLGYSKTLFKIFIINKPENFRTLTYLLEPTQIYPHQTMPVVLNDNDKALLENIISIGEKIESLIYDKSYLIGDDKEFVNVYVPSAGYEYMANNQDMSLLSLLLSHLLTIRLAFADKLKGDKEKFESYVFPNELNVRIATKLVELRQKITDLEQQITVLRS